MTDAESERNTPIRPYDHTAVRPYADTAIRPYGHTGAYGHTVLPESPAGDACVPRLELAEWAERYGVLAGITTRGASGGPPFSLGLWSDEPAGQVLTRWRALAETFHPRFTGIALGHQVHASTVQWYPDAPPGWLLLDGVDGHATTAPGLLLTVTVADCVPIYLVAPKAGAIALLHAGWRGVAGRILEAGIETLKARAGVTGSDLIMHCGVGICEPCYEVGSEVVERLTGVRSDGPQHVDLRGLLAAQAAELGVSAISISPWCSAHHRERFFSHRASGGRDGRMVAYLGRPRA